MSKAKKAAEEQSFSEQVLAEIDKKFGAVVKSGHDYVTEERQIIPVSPVLDPLLGGGIPEGSWVTAAGKSGVGKTTLAMKVAKNAQDQGRDVFFISAEGRYEKKNSEGTKGLITTKPRLTVIESTRDEVLNAEKFLSITSLIVHQVPRAFIIIDSPSALCTSTQMAEGVEAQNRGGVNKLFNEFVRQHAQLVRVQACVVWNNLHMQVNQGPYGGYIEKVPETLRYLASTRLIGRFSKDWTIGSDKKLIGQTIRWDVEKSPMTNGGTSCDGYLRYGIGIDDDMERLVLGAELGLVNKSGSWFTLDFAGGDTPKVQGLEAAWSLLQEKPELGKALQDRISELLNPVAA